MRGRQMLHPLKKINRKEDPGSYTPVSFTSVPGENVEQATVETIYRYMKTRS